MEVTTQGVPHNLAFELADLKNSRFLLKFPGWKYSTEHVYAWKRLRIRFFPLIRFYTRKDLKIIDDDYDTCIFRFELSHLYIKHLSRPDKHTIRVELLIAALLAVATRENSVHEDDDDFILAINGHPKVIHAFSREISCYIEDKRRLRYSVTRERPSLHIFLALYIKNVFKNGFNCDAQNACL